MRALALLGLFVVGGWMAIGCGGPPEDEPAPGAVGNPPPVQQAPPDMLPPEERARQGMQGGQAGDGG